MRADMAERYLTEKQVEERYSISHRSLQRYRYTGVGGPPFVRLGFRRIVYRLSDCEEWAAAQTFRSRAHELSTKSAT